MGPEILAEIRKAATQTGLVLMMHANSFEAQKLPSTETLTLSRREGGTGETSVSRLGSQPRSQGSSI
jgi:hypothetical protein